MSLRPLSTLTLPCVQRQNQEVGFWLLSWVKVVGLGDVLSFWLSTGMVREEFTGSFHPLSVVSLAHAHCWTLCELLALTNVDLIPDPVHSELRGCHVGQAEMKQAGRRVQFRILLWSVSGAVCCGNREERSLWNQMEGCSSALPARWQSQKSTAGLWNRGCISLSPARFCCYWGHCPKCYALSYAILRSLELGLLAVGYDSLPRKG